MTVRTLSRLFTVLALAMGFEGPAATARVTIFAASSLSQPIEQSLTSLPSDIEVVTSYAGSQTLARQIEAGAPASIFISANQSWMSYLDGKGLIESDNTGVFARNRLVAIRPAANIGAANDLAHLLTSSGRTRLAMGEPHTVPAGIYARQALQAQGLWPLTSARLIRADSVRTVLLWVELKEADVGFVYASDAAQSQKVTIIEEFDKKDHDPIVYAIAIVKGQSTPEVELVFNHLMSNEASLILEEMGFSPR